MCNLSESPDLVIPKLTCVRFIRHAGFHFICRIYNVILLSFLSQSEMKEFSYMPQSLITSGITG